MTMTPDEQIRFECLKLACKDESNLSRNDTNHILARARAFYNFMVGDAAAAKPSHSEGAVDALAEVEALLEKGKREGTAAS